MVDPLGVSALVATTLQLCLNLKTYISDRKRRKQEELQQALQQALQHNHQNGPLMTTAAATTPTIIYYSICTNWNLPGHAAYDYESAQSLPAHPPIRYCLHSPITLSITSSPPALSYNNINAPPFHQSWPPAPPTYSYLPLPQQITPGLSRHSSYPAIQCSPQYAPGFYPPLAPQSVINVPKPALHALRHLNSAPASLSRSPDPNSFLNIHPPASTSIDAVRISSDWKDFLHGRMVSHKPRQAPQQVHGSFSMRTSSCLNNKSESCFSHWMALQNESTQGTIAVVDWKRTNIYMFVRMDGVYFMNYTIQKCDVNMFATIFKTRQVFSGKIKEQKLEMFNAPMQMVDMTSTGVRSTNSWRILGINDESEDMQDLLNEGGSFVRMVRGALFGLVCGLYDDPSRINVMDMESSSHWRSTGHNLDIVRITTLPGHIVRRDDCVFSVFSICDQDWASEDILLG